MSLTKYYLEESFQKATSLYTLESPDTPLPTTPPLPKHLKQIRKKSHKIIYLRKQMMFSLSIISQIRYIRYFLNSTLILVSGISQLQQKCESRQFMNLAKNIIEQSHQHNFLLYLRTFFFDNCYMRKRRAVILTTSLAKELYFQDFRQLWIPQKEFWKRMLKEGQTRFSFFICSSCSRM